MSARAGIRVWAAVIALLGLPAAASAAHVEVTAVAAADGRELIDGAAELAAGQSRRFFRRDLYLEPGEVELAILIEVAVVEESTRGARIAVNAFVRPAAGGAALEWTSRTLELARGESARFGANDGEVRFELRFDPDAAPASDLRLATTISVKRLTPEGPELVERQRVRLIGSRPTEVVLASPEARGARLVVRVRPRARDEAGAVLELDVESAGADGVVGSVRDTRVELSWDDVLRIAGLRADADELLVEIKPER